MLHHRSRSCSEPEALKVYLALMEEAKARIDAINYAYHNNGRSPSRIVRETCYLQFRLLCEVIALGCLVIHGDIKTPNSIRKEYQPAKILKQLAALKASFYPQRLEITSAGGVVHHRARPDLPHLSQRELLKLWAKAGSVLHRGRVVDLDAGEDMVRSLTPIESSLQNFADIFEWIEKITGLLNCHWITLVENKKGAVVSLLSDNGRAQASILAFGSVNTMNPSVDVASFRYET